MKKWCVCICMLLALCQMGCVAPVTPAWQLSMANTGYNWGCPSAVLSWGMTEQEALAALKIPEHGYRRVDLAQDGKGTRIDIGRAFDVWGVTGFGNRLFSKDAGLFAPICQI